MHEFSGFSAKQYAEAYPPNYQVHYWHRARAELIVKQAKRWCPPGTVFLEIGCGRGHYVKVLQEAGFESYGCDSAKPPVHPEVAERVFVGVDCGSLCPAIREKVEAILLLDVIEHIEDPHNFLKHLKANYPSVKTLIVTVPARQEIWSNYDTHYRHFRRYKMDNLSSLLSDNAFSVVYISYFFHLLYLVALIFAMLGINRQTSFPQPKARRIHTILGWLLQFDWAVLPATWPGTSLICVAKPNPTPH